MSIICWEYREQPPIKDVLMLGGQSLPVYYYDLNGLMFLCAGKNKKECARNISNYVGGGIGPLKECEKEMIRVK